MQENDNLHRIKMFFLENVYFFVCFVAEYGICILDPTVRPWENNP